MRPLLVLLLSGVILGFPVAASDQPYLGPDLEADYVGPILVDNSQYLYTAQDRLNFRTADLLAAKYPHLVSLRPAIDTWAARFGIHPKVLTAVVDNYFSGSKVDGSRDDMDSVVQVVSALATVFDQQRTDPLAASRAVEATSDALFFQLNLPAGLSKVRQEGSAQEGAPVQYGYFQPPWPVGDTWAGGGAHGNSHNALDFWGEYRPWGHADVFSWWVAAMEVGTARVWAPCGVDIIHGNGWVTGYYHLENIQVADGATVGKNDIIANYADDLAQATCVGGSSSGPHVHMSLRYNTNPVSVDESNVDFTAFSHHEGQGDYDTNCNRSWYTHYTEGQICPNYDQLLNNAVQTSPLHADGFESGDARAWTNTVP